MKNFYKKILVLIVIITITNSCQKECHPEDIYYNIDDNYKTYLNYTGFDTLIFVRNSTGVTHTFINTGKITNYQMFRGSYDCSDYFHYENYAYKFVSSNFDSPLYVGQFRSQNGGSFSNISFNKYYFEGYVTFNNLKTDLDSLIIGNKIYKNVEVINSNKNNKAYFNKEFGLVKMELDFSEEWVLLSKK